MHSTAKFTKKATEGSEETDSRVSVVSEAGEPMLFMEPDQIAFPLRAKSGNHHLRKGEKVYENYSWSHLWGSNGLSSL